MIINWSLVILIVLLCFPGMVIAIPRLINFLLKTNSAEVKKRISLFAIGQTTLMVFIMSLAGSILSQSSGLSAPILEPLLKRESIQLSISDSLLPVFLYTAIGLVIFLIVYYSLAARVIDDQNRKILTQMRGAIGLDGCMLYGVVDEVLARWGLLNVLIFFGLLLTGQTTSSLMWGAIIVSSVIYSIGQLPPYLAAGCKASRSFLYTLVLLSSLPSLLFGFLFWQFGLLAAIFAHMLFHLGWWLYDKPDPFVKE